ncbi:MAG: ribonuclease J [Acidimicrobiia bacterium]
MSVRVTFLGGLGEIGRNCAALEIDGKICLIDVGLMFPEEDMLGVDLVFPDWSWLMERKDDVEFVLLTHGHEDHMGALGYFLRDINVPVYGTKLALEFCRGRIEELGIDAQLHPVEYGEWKKHGQFKFQLIPVSHSVPDAAGIAFDTPEGIIIHSGDFKLDPTPIDGRPTDLPTFAEFGKKGVRLLLSDSTNAERPGFVPSESSLAEPIRDIVRDAPGRVIAACFSSHIHRVQQIADAGITTGRKVAFFGRSMHRNTEVGLDLEVLDLPKNSVVDIKDLMNLPAHQQLLITTGSQGEPFAALSLMAQGRHKFVDLEEGDTVLISATPIPGNETAVSKVISRLTRRGARVFHGRNAPVHVSGHAARDELLTFLNVIRPEAFVPVHGEYRHLHAHAELARKMGVRKVDVLEDGDAVVLDGDRTMVERRAVPAGYVYFDGAGVGDVKRGVLRDRSRLADEGVVVVTVGIERSTGSIVFGPDLDSHGLMDDPSAILQKASEAVRAEVERRATDGSFDHAAMQNAVRQAAATVIRAETTRKPVILPVVLDV